MAKRKAVKKPKKDTVNRRYGAAIEDLMTRVHKKRKRVKSK